MYTVHAMTIAKRTLHAALAAIAPMLIVFVAEMLVFLAADAFVPPDLQDTRTYILLMDLLPDIAAFLAVLWIYRLDGRCGIHKEDRSFKTPVRLYVICCLGIVGLYLLVDVALNVSGIIEWDTAFQEVDDYFSRLGTAWNLLTAGIVAPILEEFLFRGVIMSRIRADLSAIPAVIGSALLFGIYHGNWTQGIAAFILGLFLAAACEIFDALFLSILMHASVNIFSTLLLGTEAGLALLNEPAAPLVLLLYCLISSAVLLRTLWKYGRRKSR